MTHLPIIHPNGTAKGAIIAALTDAIDAVHAAQDKLKLTAPNGRDYYPEPGRLDVAEKVFRIRMNALWALARDLEADMFAIDQG